MFTAFDWTTMTLYLLVVAGIGFYFAKRNVDLAGYLFGSGRMPWPAVGISLIATSVSATTFLGNPAETFDGDMTYVMLNIGVFLSIGVVWFVFIPRLRQAGIQSAYQLLEVKFSPAVRTMAATFYSLHLVLRTGILIYGPALVVAEMFQIDLYVAIAIMAVLATGYTYLGGLQAVVWTDVLQFFVLFGGGIWVLWTCADAIGGVGAMAEMASTAGKTHWWDASMDPSDAHTLLSAGLIYTVFEVAIRGCDQQFVQRYLACRDVKRANYSSLLSAVLGLAVGLLFYWVGAALFVYYEVSGVGMLPPDTGVNRVFPYFILDVLPMGITGLMVAAVFAAAMSSLDSAITALANTTIQDFRPRWGRGQDAVAGEPMDQAASDRGQLRYARHWTLVWGVVGTVAAMICAVGQQSLLTKALFFTSLFIGPLLGLFLFAFFRSKTQPRSLLIGAVMGMVCLAVFNNNPFTAQPVMTMIAGIDPIWLWVALGVFSSILATLLLVGRRSGQGRLHLVIVVVSLVVVFIFISLFSQVGLFLANLSWPWNPVVSLASMTLAVLYSDLVWHWLAGEELPSRAG